MSTKEILYNCYYYGCHICHKVLPRVKTQNGYTLKDIISEEDMHVFRGYYDIDYFDANRRNMIYHSLSIHPEEQDIIRICKYDMNTKQTSVIGHSRAWNWQQGCRLRWYSDCLIGYNDLVEDRYVHIIKNIESNNAVLVNEPIYDTYYKGDFGLSLDFKRLHRLRPGYGYDKISDETQGILHPNNNGIKYVNFGDNSSQVILTNKDVFERIGCSLEGESYFNHISISPSGNAFMFFFIVYDKKQRYSKVYVLIYDLRNCELTVIENEDKSSHYTWLNNDEILITYYRGKKQGYKICNIINGKKSDIGRRILNEDGHPSVCDNHTIISDTYPKRSIINEQLLFAYDRTTEKRKVISSLYSDWRFNGVQRCDLHPSVSGQYITVDSTALNCRRSIFIFE